ncbi:hypothetical protein [Halomonas elongata]|uniref:hypothetical protein n=1 Tax=Halomonas elongata TaxID=2746 RepID=UPI00186B96BA|nr:hypothetical protein [Halomonas elongata]MBW5802028.1 hypothetical protein [Halomonas elongata]
MTRDEWQKVDNPWRIVEAAAYDSHARDAAVVRIIDTCLELKLVRRHDGVGYRPFSVTGTVPMPGSGRNIDQAMLAAERYRPESDWHKMCGWLLDQIPSRQAAAMMLQAARIRPDKLGSCQWSVTASQMVARQALLLRDLGMGECVPTPFQSVEDLQKAAQRARKRLRQWLAEETRQQHVDEVSG